MFSVGIVVPSWHYFANPFKLQPMWEPYFATLMDERFPESEVRASVIDLRDARKADGGFSPEQAARRVPARDIYFFWVTKTGDYPEVQAVSKELRRSHPRSVHMAGGTHVDIFPEECGRDFDAVFQGPGEESLVKAVRDTLVRGAPEKFYRDEWKKRQYDDYPIARREYLPERAIVNTELFEKYGGLRGTSAMLQRGCSFKCAYCVYNVPCAIQARSPAKIRAEIEYLKKNYRIRGLNLRDEIAIPVIERKARPFLEAIGEGGLKWRGQTKVGSSKTSIVPREVIRLAAQTGCVELALGVETASQQVMDIIDKRQNLGQVGEYIANCHEFGIKIKMCLILGLPGEPEDIVEQTIALIEQAKPDFVNVSGFCPVPGSPIARDPGGYGIRHIDTDWSKHAHLLFRFGDSEDFGLPFEYEKKSRWGKTFTREQIVANIRSLQQYLRQRGMVY